MTSVKIVRTDSTNPDFRALVALLDQELLVRDGEEHVFYANFNKLDKISHVVVAHVERTAVGCGALRKFSEDSAEIKRMFVQPTYRGKGIAGKVLLELENWARELGFTACVLETGQKQPEAIRLYQKSGYTQIPNFGQYQGVVNSVCMRKTLTRQARAQ